MEAVDRGLHVLIAKPIVKTLEEHLTLADAARRSGVLVAMEVHKRWDPIYADARDRIRQLGEFSFFSSFMSQPKYQLETFRSWAGKSSDISYYLNAHHIDFNVWSVGHVARPLSVTALASTGVAKSQGIDAEDTITLGVQWENIESGSLASAFYTASWIAPKSDVHSQQRFYYLGQKGEVQIDQAHRGYSLATDAAGFSLAQPAVHEVHARCPGLFFRPVGLRLPQHRGVCRRGRAGSRRRWPRRPISAAAWRPSTTRSSSPRFSKPAAAASTAAACRIKSNTPQRQRGGAVGGVSDTCSHARVGHDVPSAADATVACFASIRSVTHVARESHSRDRSTVSRAGIRAGSGRTPGRTPSTVAWPT